MNNKYLYYTIQIVFFLIIGYILYIYFKNIDWNVLKNTKINWFFVSIALFLTLFIRFIYPYIWIFILKEFGYKLKNYRMLNYIYAKSWMGRYIPGKVAWIGGKIFFGSQQGISKTTLSFASILDGLIQVISGLALGLFTLSFDDKGTLNRQLVNFSIITFLCLLLVIYPPVFNKIASLAYKILRKKELKIENKLRLSTLVKTFILFLLISLLTGIAIYFICLSVSPNLGFRENIFFLSGVTSLAGAIGTLSIFAPSGLGVREGVSTIFYLALFPKEIVLIILILIRLYSTFADVLFLIIGRILVPRK